MYAAGAIRKERFVGAADDGRIAARIRVEDVDTRAGGAAAVAVKRDPIPVHARVATCESNLGEATSVATGNHCVGVRYQAWNRAGVEIAKIDTFEQTHTVRTRKRHVASADRGG